MDAIDGYVAELGRALRGPARVKRDLLAEARDGLVDATEAYQRAGVPPAEAGRRAVADFGPIRQVAAAYQPELALSQARRTALLTGAVVTAQPLLWGLTEGWRGPGQPGPGYALVDQLLTGLGSITVLAALLAVLAGGVGVRYLGRQPWLARAVGLGGLFTCGGFAVLGLLMNLLGAAALGPALLWLTGLLLLPLTAVAASARRCLAVR